MEAPLFFARRPFQYGDRPDDVLDRGQVLTLRAQPNDEKLVRLGYLGPVDPGAELYACAECGRQFVDLGARTGHGNDRHRREGVDEKIRRRADQLVEAFLADGLSRAEALREATQLASREILRDEDARQERLGNQLDRDAPLYLEKTAASARG